MNRQFILLLFFLMFCSQALSQDPQSPEKTRKVAIIYDSKQDTTVVRFGPMHIINFSSLQGEAGNLNEEGELRLTAFFTYKGQTFVKPESVALIFLSINRPLNRWELSHQKDFEIKADDGRWKIPDVAIVSSKNGSNIIVESLGVSVPCEIFAKVANAKKVKMRLGDRTFDLGKEHLGPLRDLASRAGC
jgi:hypothetical protein